MRKAVDLLGKGRDVEQGEANATMEIAQVLKGGQRAAGALGTMVRCRALPPSGQRPLPSTGSANGSPLC